MSPKRILYMCALVLSASGIATAKTAVAFGGSVASGDSYNGTLETGGTYVATLNDGDKISSSSTSGGSRIYTADLTHYVLLGPSTQVQLEAASAANNTSQDDILLISGSVEIVSMYDSTVPPANPTKVIVRTNKVSTIAKGCDITIKTLSATSIWIGFNSNPSQPIGPFDLQSAVTGGGAPTSHYTQAQYPNGFTDVNDTVAPPQPGALAVSPVGSGTPQWLSHHQSHRPHWPRHRWDHRRRPVRRHHHHGP
jgi:hypothetical protein